MLSQLLFVRLKAAENALRDGRLDEAYRLATARDIREHRRGAAVLLALTERFMERARAHFRADRFTEALLDLDKAAAGGVRTEEIAELRRHVRTVAEEWERHDQSRRERLEAARRRIEGGSLAAGRRMLDQVAGDEPGVEKLRRAAQQRAEEAVNMVRLAEDLLAQGQWAAAAQRIRRAKAIDAHHEEVLRVENRLCAQVLESARRAVIAGRLSRAADELACLEELANHLPARRELDGILSTVFEIARHLRADAYSDARRVALRLTQLLPEAEWLRTAAEQLRQVDDLRTALLAGPIGGITEMHEKPKRAAPFPAGAKGEERVPAIAQRKFAADETVALPRDRGRSSSVQDRHLLLVDGGGSYLILHGSMASVGRSAASRPADVPIISDIAERHANVQRVEDGYFLFSPKDVEVAGRKAQHHLLHDGDRIVLGRRAKMTFRLPSRRSNTAVLDLSDTTRMPHDVRRVVLFDQHATIGASSTDHIPYRHAGSTLVLFERNGALWIRRRNDGHADTEPVPIMPGVPVEMDGARLVVQPWPAAKTGSMT